MEEVTNSYLLVNLNVWLSEAVQLSKPQNLQCLIYQLVNLTLAAEFVYHYFCLCFEPLICS